MGARFPEKVALVTDALSDAGREIALRLAGRGYGVALGYADGMVQADLLTDEIIDRGGRAVAIRADVARTNDASQLVSETVRLLGRLDLVVNNAMCAGRDVHPFFSASVRGSLHMLQHAPRYLGPDGRLIDVSTDLRPGTQIADAVVAIALRDPVPAGCELSHAA